MPLARISLSSPLLWLLAWWTLARNSSAKATPPRLIAPDANCWPENVTIAFPGDPAFYNATERWNAFERPTFDVVITPATEADVVRSVVFARSKNVSFLATGGRHGYGTSLGRLQQGLAIDLGNLKTVSVDRDAGKLTVGGGVRMGEILEPLHDAGYELQIGSCSCPGLVGATLGAGVGRWSGVYGMIIDALESVRLVTADGRIVRVSETSYPELFWGIRGAGANYGIITEATYRLHKTSDASSKAGLVMNVDIIVPAELSTAYFEVLESFNGSMPARLAVASVINYNATANAPAILANWVYMGSEVEGREAMAPLFQLNLPVVSVTTVPWSKVLATAGFGIDPLLCVDNVIRSIYSANVRNLSASTMAASFEKMAKFYNNFPDARASVLEFETFANQAAMAVPHDSTAYPWRDATGNMIFEFIWTDKNGPAVAASATLGKELRDHFSRTSGYPELSVYVCYAHGDEALESIYGRDQLPRLAKLKKIWDPHNVFAFNNAIPTKWP